MKSHNNKNKYLETVHNNFPDYTSDTLGSVIKVYPRFGTKIYKFGINGNRITGVGSKRDPDLVKRQKKGAVDKVRADSSIYRTRTQFTDKALCNMMGEYNVFATFTFQDNFTDIDGADRHFQYFKTELARQYPNVKVLAVGQFQKRGAVHYHAILMYLTQEQYEGCVPHNRLKVPKYDPRYKSTLDGWFSSEIWKLWSYQGYLACLEGIKQDINGLGFDFVDCEPIGDGRLSGVDGKKEALDRIRYCTRYITRDNDMMLYSKVAYFYSQGLKKPLKYSSHRLDGRIINGAIEKQIDIVKPGLLVEPFEFCINPCEFEEDYKGDIVGFKFTNHWFESLERREREGVNIEQVDFNNAMEGCKVSVMFYDYVPYLSPSLLDGWYKEYENNDKAWYKKDKLGQLMVSVEDNDYGFYLDRRERDVDKDSKFIVEFKKHLEREREEIEKKKELEMYECMKHQLELDGW